MLNRGLSKPYYQTSELLDGLQHRETIRNEKLQPISNQLSIEGFAGGGRVPRTSTGRKPTGGGPRGLSTGRADRRGLLSLTGETRARTRTGNGSSGSSGTHGVPPGDSTLLGTSGTPGECSSRALPGTLREPRVARKEPVERRAALEQNCQKWNRLTSAVFSKPVLENSLTAL